TFERDQLRLLLRIRLGDLGVGNVAALQVVFQTLNRAISLGVDGVIDLHLKYQVRAALEIKPEVDAALHCRQQSSGREALRYAENAEQEDQQYGDDEDDFRREILVHDETTTLGRLGSLLLRCE